MTPVPFIVAPWIVPEAVILVAPLIAPAFVMVPELLFIPPVTETPPEAVRSPAAVIVPLPVVVRLPEVVALPSSSIVRLETPPDRTSKAIPVVPAAVSLTITAGAVPAFVIFKDVDAPRDPARLNAISRPVVVVMVLPLLYAVCNVVTAAAQVAIWLDTFRQSADVPFVPSVGT